MAETDLTTTSAVKALLSITTSTYDVVIAQLIEGASLFLEKLLNREFFKDGGSTEEFFDGGKSTLIVKKYPIESVVSVSERTGDYNNPTWQDYVATGDYIVDNATGEIHFVFTLPTGFRNIRVVYTGGFDDPSTEAPRDIRMACEKLVIKEFNKRKSQGISIEKIGDISINWEANMDDNLKSLISVNQNLII